MLHEGPAYHALVTAGDLANAARSTITRARSAQCACPWSPVTTGAMFATGCDLAGPLLQVELRRKVPRTLPDTAGFVAAMDELGDRGPVALRLAAAQPCGAGRAVARKVRSRPDGRSVCTPVRHVGACTRIVRWRLRRPADLRLTRGLQTRRPLALHARRRLHVHAHLEHARGGSDGDCGHPGQVIGPEQAVDQATAPGAKE